MVLTAGITIFTQFWLHLPAICGSSGRFGISGLVIVSRLRDCSGATWLGFQTLRSLGYRDPKDDARAKFDGLSTR